MINSPTKIRYAVWAAVSTTQQAADDKYSISSQVASSRERANSKGWIETSGPYLVPGSSRSMWVDLTAAAQAIPSLGQMLEDARDHKFDLLIFSEYDRFRDLVDLVGMTLNHYGIQLYSISQPSEPLLPETYNPYASDAEPILRDVSKIASRIAVNNMRRKYFENMPERVRSQGLNAISLPYGYKKPEGSDTERNKAVGVQDPALILHVIAMKDLFLAGRSLRQIRDHLVATGAPTPRGKGVWHGRVIRDILTNPFYAGIVRFGVSHVTHDLMNGKKERRDRSPDPSRMVVAQGKHIPIWDIDTHQAILAELRKRPRNYRGQISQRLTGLLACNICGARLHMHYRYKKGAANNAITWRCSRGGSPHVSVADEVMLERVTNEVYRILDNIENIEQESTKTTGEDLASLLARKKRISDAFEHGDMDLEDYSNRARVINAEIKKLEKEERNMSSELAEIRQRDDAVAYLRSLGKSLGEVILFGDQQHVNHILRAAIAEIVVDGEGNIVKSVMKKRV